MKKETFLVLGDLDCLLEENFICGLFFCFSVLSEIGPKSVSTGADPGGGGPRFWGPKIEVFRPLFNISVFF